MVGSEYQISITFQTLDIEKYENSCKADYVEIYDGQSKESKLLGKFCGNDLPDRLVTSGNIASVHFSSDDSVEKLGFKLIYQPVQEHGKERPIGNNCLYAYTYTGISGRKIFINGIFIFLYTQSHHQI